ncbi:MAG: hypothetical protein KatS3mg031_2813 [Chitinophagales bacterium]|nr:MAG: hypothetical protein KatS3mg031_2813 [Chitinophagales bacterium]
MVAPQASSVGCADTYYSSVVKNNTPNSPGSFEVEFGDDTNLFRIQKDAAGIRFYRVGDPPQSLPASFTVKPVVSGSRPIRVINYTPETVDDCAGTNKRYTHYPDASIMFVINNCSTCESRGVLVILDKDQNYTNPVVGYVNDSEYISEVFVYQASNYVEESTCSNPCTGAKIAPITYNVITPSFTSCSSTDANCNNLTSYNGLSIVIPQGGSVSINANRKPTATSSTPLSSPATLYLSAYSCNEEACECLGGMGNTITSKEPSLVVTVSITDCSTGSTRTSSANLNYSSGGSDAFISMNTGEYVSAIEVEERGVRETISNCPGGGDGFTPS